MASNKKPLNSAHQATKGELSIDDKIMKQIFESHGHTSKKFDVRLVFAVIKDILNRVTLVVDNVDLLVGRIGMHYLVDAKQAHLEEEVIQASVSLPLCELKQLSLKMACKTPGEDIAQKTMSIFKTLSSYSWDAKAVLTIGAFALDYGELCLLDQLHPTNQLAKSIGILKGMSTILKRPHIPKCKNAILKINDLIEAALKVSECIFKLEELRELSTKYNIEDVLELSRVMDSIHVDVSWAITTAIACRTQISYLINDEDKNQDLLPFIEKKINGTLEVLERNLEVCDKEIRNSILEYIMQNPRELKMAIDEMTLKPPNDGSANKEVDIEKKNVIFYLAKLEITDKDFAVLEPIYKEISKNDEYTIVWIPVVDKWTDDLKNKLEILGSKMPPYIVHNVSSKLGIKEWQFKDRPIVVVMNSQEIGEHSNALRMMTFWGIEAFPYTLKKEEELSNGDDWFGYLMFDICPELSSWIKDGKPIFFYGGKDEKWIKNFTEKASDKDEALKRENAMISAELFCVEKGSKGQKDDHNILWDFWNRLGGFLSSRTSKNIESDQVIKVLQKMLSYQHLSGWAVMSKGSTLVMGGHKTTILEVSEEFDQWKKLVSIPSLETSLRDITMLFMFSIVAALIALVKMETP